ncbi:hypothetical protein K788_0001784 (plasmid) [Paraburkholderia caribensis MBA4]|uniref:Uncharacterized protein n=1 Tax=Paraburkholderia caribensis MBA4 TaxID=1323664 RepID=A0A0P0RQW6_9BURK|nr:hypothetical protein [Paraburkholderia caribensis]ALL71423.1 hypothetical protein K788_0001784 [Paraburkholderia caribensis MBA4]
MKALDNEDFKNALHAVEISLTLFGKLARADLPMCKPCKAVCEKALQRIAA